MKLNEISYQGYQVTIWIVLAYFSNFFNINLPFSYSSISSVPSNQSGDNKLIDAIFGFSFF